jgi:predicted transcriptional regulator
MLNYVGNPGPFDEYHPGLVNQQPYVGELLYAVSQGVGDTAELAELLSASEQDINEALTKLARIGAVTRTNGAYSLGISVLTRADLRALEPWFEEVTSAVVSELKKCRAELRQPLEELSASSSFSLPELLYHVVGCYALDWKALYWFAKNDIIVLEREQPGNRSYVMIGLEDGEQSQERELFCSSQNKKSGRYYFSTFGDNTGPRLHAIPGFFWGLERELESGFPAPSVLDGYKPLLATHHNELVARCGELLEKLATGEGVPQDEDTDRVLAFLQKLDYIGEDSTGNPVPRIPVFLEHELSCLRESSDIVIGAIGDMVAELLRELPSRFPELGTLQAGGHVKDLNNELWHQLLGRVNNQLIEAGYLAGPKSYKGEGSYRACLYVVPEGFDWEQL